MKNLWAALGVGAAWLVVAMPALIRSAIAIGGAGLIAYGAWLVYAPAGFIVGGILLIVGVFLAEMSAAD